MLNVITVEIQVINMGVKMNKLLAILIIGLSLSANAKTIAELPNKGGGKIILTDNNCRTKGYKLAYTQMDGASTLLGCWTSDNSFVHILWYDNDLRSYGLEYWQLTNDVKPTL